MRLGLLGDIHGNRRALEVVLAAATSFGVESLLITGDLVGYYFEPLEVLKLLEPWSKHAVRGNHEDMLSVARSNANFLETVDARYGLGLRCAIEQLDDGQLDDLCALPHPKNIEIGDCKILLCHGIPSSAESYLYPDAPQESLAEFSLFPYDFIIMGHTHYPMNIKVGTVRLVNPSSVGQPRTKEKGAAWAILDTNTREVVFRSESYDATSLINECRIRHPGIPYLAEVLCKK